jgi:aspartate-semialdehyde dehydrogenase
MKIALLGATGVVGQEMCKVLEERKFPLEQLIPIASEKSVGKKVWCQGKEWTVVSAKDALRMKPDLALFSAGATASKKWAPLFAEEGIYVVDNSSAWRMDPGKKLVVPEVNGKSLTRQDYIIANPNCSTIQMVMALAPLHEEYEIKRLVISTYQSVSGTGIKAIRQYESEVSNKPVEEPAYPYVIFGNCLPHCDIFLENDYTKEEMKLVHETRKILGDENMKITATAVRVPVTGGHSESVNVELLKAFEKKDIISLLNKADGVTVLDDPANNIYPMPVKARGSDEVFVGRIRKDESIANGLNIWIVSDNLRKGAATNAIQIAELLIKKGFLKHDMN